MPMSHIPVGGRIQHPPFNQNWLNLIQDQWVRNIIHHGYQIEFIQTPPFNGVRETPLNKGPHQEVLIPEVQNLLEKGAIEPVPPDQENEGFYSTFFMVTKKTGGWRPILNLKPLNKYIASKTFKMESLRSVRKALEPEDWMISIDLQDAYMHIPIHKDFRIYLRFKIGGQAYQFVVLPFGLSSAPRVFTKMLAPLVAIARLEGLYLYPYLDDWLLKFRVRETLIVMGQRLVDLLESSGLIINVPKSFLEPSQKREFIGGHFQTDLNVVTLPQDRLLDLIAKVEAFKPNTYKTARQFLKLLGTMAAAIEVVLHCRLRMRPIQLYLMAHWDQKSRDLEALVPVRDTLIQHLQWWKDPQNLGRGVPLTQPQPTLIITTDASSQHGWGGFLGDIETQGPWEPEVWDRHINWLEMEAVFRTCQHFHNQIQNQSVLIKCDNSTVVSYINKQGGTHSPSLCMLTWKLLIWAQERGVTLKAEHIPGEKNVRADRLSRVFASAIEWRLNPKVVQTLFLRWDRPLIDLFATEANRQLETYCSRYKEKMSYHVDALTMNWGQVYGYAFPPISLIPLVIERVERFRCTLILIAPRWPRRSWFPKLLEMSIAFPIQMPQAPDLLTQDKGKLQHPAPGRLQLVAWKLSGDASLVKDFRQKWLTQCSVLSDQNQLEHMNASGQNMYAGAIQNRLIPLQPL